MFRLFRSKMVELVPIGWKCKQATTTAELKEAVHLISIPSCVIIIMLYYFSLTRICRAWPTSLHGRSTGILNETLLRNWNAWSDELKEPSWRSFVRPLFWPKSKVSVTGQKPWTIVRRFGRNRGHILCPFYSSLEGAMKLKLGPFCSS